MGLKKKVSSRKGKKATPQAYAAVAVASKGNSWWELRSKHGRDKLFASPELMLNAAKEYFKYCDEHPEYEVKPIVERGKIKMVKIPHRQPYSLVGLCLYIGCSTAYFRMFKHQQNDSESSKDFITVIHEIENAVYKQQYDGAASGFFNANIISRALGLAEKVETDVTDNRKQTADLFPTELNGDKK